MSKNIFFLRIRDHETSANDTFHQYQCQPSGQPIPAVLLPILLLSLSFHRLDETPKLSIKGPCYPSWDPSLSPRKTDLELRPSKRETGWTRALLQLHPEESVHCVLLPRLLMLFPSCPSWGQSAQLSSFNPVNKLPWSFHKCFCFIQLEVVFAACNEESYSIN